MKEGIKTFAAIGFLLMTLLYFLAVLALPAAIIYYLVTH